VRELIAFTDEQGVAVGVQQLDVLVGSYVLSVDYAAATGASPPMPSRRWRSFATTAAHR
jgi:hypothetical protein